MISRPVFKIIELVCVIGGMLGLTKVLESYLPEHFDQELILAVWPYVYIPLCAAVSFYTQGAIQTITGLLDAEAEDDDESV